MMHEFPKSRRLLKRSEFVAAQRLAVGVRGKHCVMLLHDAGRDGPARLGLVASRRVGNAVVRNRAKRKIREWFRQCEALPRGRDVVVIVLAGASDASWHVLRRELDGALGKVMRKARRAGDSSVDA
jgi:ribonuclease P protein component